MESDAANVGSRIDDGKHAKIAELGGDTGENGAEREGFKGCLSVNRERDYGLATDSRSSTFLVVYLPRLHIHDQALALQPAHPQGRRPPS